jgi:hypothetical protein
MIVKPAANIRSVIEFCYGEDTELISTYHTIAGSSLLECIEFENEILDQPDGNILTVELDNGELLGYFGKSLISVEDLKFPFMTTIFVRPKYRKKEFMGQFWNVINKEFENQTFLTAIYKNNTRASKFFNKFADDCFETEVNGNTALVFTFNLGVTKWQS